MLLFLRIVFGVVALALIAVAFAMNGYYWYRGNASDVTAQSLGILFSVIAGSIKVASPLYIVFKGSSFRTEKKLGFAFALALIFDLWSGLSYTNMTRTEARAVIERNTDARAELQRQINADDAAAKKLPDARPLVVVRSLSQTADAAAGSCRGRNEAASDTCKDAAKLRAELAAATEADRLTASIDTARRALATLTKEEPTSTAAAMAKSLKDSWGLDVAASVLENVWSAIMLGLIEVAPLALITTLADTKPATPRQVSKPSVNRLPAPKPGAAITVLDLLRAEPVDATGWIAGLSQQKIAEKLRTSKTSVNRELKDLITAGVILQDNGRRPAALKVA